jgi:hypothetical protein
LSKWQWLVKNASGLSKCQWLKVRWFRMEANT